MKNRRTYLVFLICLIWTGCSYEFPEETIPRTEDLGDINPQNILVIGDGFLGGFMDGALYDNGQVNSVGKMLSRQINLIDTVPFNQAGINSETGYNVYVSQINNLYGKWFYRFENQTSENPQFVLKPGEEIKAYSGDKTVLNDLTVPLLAVKDLSDADFTSNQFLSRVYAENNTNLIEQIGEKSPSLVFLWIGMNDVLNYAINGATQSGELTEENVFKTNFQQLIQSIISNSDAKIVVGDLISISNFPYFYHRPYNSIFLDNKEMAAASARYAAFNLAVAEHNRNASPENQRPFVDFVENGSNLAPQKFVVEDNSLSSAFYSDGTPLEKYRQVTENEYVFYLLTEDSTDEGLGTIVPLSEDWYLSEESIKLIENTTDTFNDIIREVVNRHSERMVLVPFHDEIHAVAETGKKDAWGEPLNDEIIYFDGLPVEGTLRLNGVYSLDGLHFNQRGNAYLANFIIRQMNSELNSNLQSININSFVGNAFSE
ncbi:SGNH/GDSL hydrolase family protein [Draconibacterium mangrovi]|uniref:SGNH/GDSL hydrolase family protein n=1 Tax=Draconibacterium mangrovi TaxID=2697469 RepID=UPI0013D39AC1|nr:SGNH/GDSL hydrolase family protein [Draconibacterium mangrovi]